MENALLQQKVEFLEMELEEVRRREENLKRVNNSLMSAINNEPTILKDQTLNELQKANEQYITELAAIKKKHKEETAELEKELQDLFLAKKEMQIDLKHQKTAAESEKYELLAIIKQMESEKLAVDKNKVDNVLGERNQKERYRQSFEKSLGDSRGFYNKENESLKGKIEVLSTKLKSKKEKIKRLSERNNEKALRVRIEELEEENETYKMICKKQGPSFKAESDKSIKKELEEALSTIEKLKKNGNDRGVNELKCLLAKKDMESKEIWEKLYSSNAEIERLTSELNKTTLKLKQSEIYWAMSDEKRTETESALKNEIKFLIGKLLKAKSKLGAEESNDTTVKSSMVTTVRSKSVKKQAGKMIYPLDLSVIMRPDSPFCVSHIDI